ncbi:MULTISPECIES: DUF3515 family protein [Streptomyces]|uniref:DUF3515 family protein n=1 Tax=Streptomyces heilongjiangensis TaxID=945052 RepID=A0ABW1BJV7_9ACTN|nr:MULTISPECIES: DUF3515 family protein [Streptomyces]MDC2952661.1 DUF3515 family protein [Streptomyces heilongjiangensis]
MPKHSRTLPILASVLTLAGAALLAIQFLPAEAPSAEGAPQAKGAICRDLAEGYPDKIGGHEKTATSPGAAVYGDNVITLRCGLPEMLPTTDMCVTVNGVDWVLKNSGQGEGDKTITTFGRKPAAEAVIDPEVPSDVALVELAAAVKNLPRNGHRCIDQDDAARPSPTGSTHHTP